ncbi:hypothetical protein ANN_21474, partial [Periplaneta americana]
TSFRAVVLSLCSVLHTTVIPWLVLRVLRFLSVSDDLIICELRERIDILTKHVNLLNIHYQATSNVNNNGYEQCDSAERHGSTLVTLQVSSSEQLKSFIGN